MFYLHVDAKLTFLYITEGKFLQVRWNESSVWSKDKKGGKQ